MVNTQEEHILVVIGQGYVGLPLAMAAVDAGWHVYGVDTDTEKVAKINNGSSPVEDISDATLRVAISSSRYQATTDFSLVSAASVVALCVPTPLNENREPDLTLLQSATQSVASYLKSNSLLVCESTSFPGTLRNVVIPLVNKFKSNLASKIHFATAPERVNPGDLVWGQRNTPRLIGAVDPDSLNKAVTFYSSICDQVVPVSSPEIAEGAKLLENTFRLVNISLINELAALFSSQNIDINQVIDAASSKPYGFMPFRPGIGIGGHCIPIDPLYLTWWASEKNVKLNMVEMASKISEDTPVNVAKRIMESVDSRIPAPRILIVGVAYKSGVSDTRETPVKNLKRSLKEFGAVVAWHDPLVNSWDNECSETLYWECDLIVVATMHPEVDKDYLMQNRSKVIDFTNSL